MADSKLQKIPDHVKLIGGSVMLIVAVAVFVHRLPRMSYVEVHADKPRPAAPKPAPASAAPAPAPKTQSSQTSKPALSSTVPKTSAAPVLAWDEACSSESGLLCYGMTSRPLRRCLNGYYDALRKNCRAALNPKREDAP